MKNMRLFACIFLNPEIAKGVSRWKVYQAGKQYDMNQLYIGTKHDSFEKELRQTSKNRLEGDRTIFFHEDGTWAYMDILDQKDYERKEKETMYARYFCQDIRPLKKGKEKKKSMGGKYE